MSKRHYAVAIVLLCLFVAAGTLPASAQRDVVVASTSNSTKYPITPSMMSQFSMGLNPLMMSSRVSPGNSGNGVISLQRSLYLLGYLNESNITGTFDQTTLDAVKKFQCENNVVCSANLGLGTVGPQTRGKLNLLIRARVAQLAKERGYGRYATTTTTTPVTPPAPVKPICPMMKRMCPNGMYVSPSGPNCEFSCPTPTSVTPVTPPVKGGACVRSGCSSQLCVDAKRSGLITTCEWRSEYACYANATCERQSTGECGWTQTDSLKQCIANSGTTAGATW